MPRRTPRPVVAGAVLVALALVFVGYLIGLSSPWSAHKPTVVSGTVERVRSDVPWAVFTPDGGGEQVEVYLDQVVWRTRADHRFGVGPALPSPGECVDHRRGRHDRGEPAVRLRLLLEDPVPHLPTWHLGAALARTDSGHAGWTV
jgi:hypothetical protein